MGVMRATFLFVAAALAGALNSVAGGGSFVALPALLFTGVSPVLANTTSTVALWPGGVASVAGYRECLRRSRARLVALCAASLLGGAAGARLLLGTTDAAFVRLIPWLLLAATLLFTFGGAAAGKACALAGRRGSAAFERAGVLIQFVIAIYGGYFGGGMGIMMLAALSLMGLTNLHEMNGVKALLGSAINGVAVVSFVAANAVAWRPAAIMIVGAVAGGYLGASLARRLDPARVRRFVVVFAWAMTLYFFARG